MIKLNINNIKTLDFIESRIEIGRNKNIVKNIEILREEDDSVNIIFKNEKAISRNHCEIFQKDAEWFVEDKKSTNGTFLNDKRVKESNKLKDGDKLSLGKETFIFIEIEDLENTYFEGVLDFEEDLSEEDEPTNYIQTRLYIEEEHIATSMELSPSTLLNRGQYQIVKQLGKSNNFTITYLAKDISLDSHVVIKEYFPKEYANRSRDNKIVSTNQYNFDLGYQAFKEEAKVIANIPNHSNIIGIKNFFEENGTTYHVIDYIKGDSLTKYVTQNHPLNQKTIDKIIFPLLEGIKHLHKYNILHRNIKLSNILICKNGNPILIDFDISQDKIKRHSQNAKKIEIEGYKPIEQQLGEKEGKYTDIYAIGMVMYALVNGIINVKELPSSKQRLAIFKTEGKSSVNFYYAKKFSKNFIKAIEKAIELRPIDRPQSVEELSKLLTKKGLFSWLF